MIHNNHILYFGNYAFTRKMTSAPMSCCVMFLIHNMIRPSQYQTWHRKRSSCLLYMGNPIPAHNTTHISLLNLNVVDLIHHKPRIGWLTKKITLGLITSFNGFCIPTLTTFFSHILKARRNFAQKRCMRGIRRNVSITDGPSVRPRTLCFVATSDHAIPSTRRRY